MTTQNDANAKGTAVSPSWTWGSSARLVFDTSAEPGTIINASAQLAQVSLPEPAICSFYLQAAILVQDPLDTVETFTVNLLEGIGRVTVPRQVSFSNQPANLSPLEFTLPFVPVHALNVNVEATINHRSELPSPTCEIEIYFVLAPLTRIPQAEQRLAFGMAMPGEADSLDDDLRDELETEGPTAQQAVLNGRTLDGEGINGEGDDVEGDDDDDDDDGEELTPAERIIAAFTERHGRRPTRIEFKTVVQRIKQRNARRQGR